MKTILISKSILFILAASIFMMFISVIANNEALSTENATYRLGRVRVSTTNTPWPSEIFGRFIYHPGQ